MLVAFSLSEFKKYREIVMRENKREVERKKGERGRGKGNKRKREGERRERKRNKKRGEII